jgi:hypothetical protein
MAFTIRKYRAVIERLGRLSYEIRKQLVFSRGTGQGLSKQSWEINSIFNAPSKSARELYEDDPAFGCQESTTPGSLLRQ